MLRYVLIKLKKYLFCEHKYYIGCKEYNILKEQMSLKSIGKTYFSMFYNDIFRDMIYELKYKKRKYVSKILAKLIEKDVKYILHKENIEEVLLTPISKKRMKERGFNQVEEIIKHLGIEYRNILKVEDTIKMSKLKESYEKRLNILNSFNVSNLFLEGRRVLIIDDIITTGSTVKEIIRELKKEYLDIEIYVYCIAISKKFRRIDEGNL